MPKKNTVFVTQWKSNHSESGKSKDVIHYYTGQIVPEPWATWYRGY